MVVKLFNTSLKGYLSASICNINKVLPKLKINQKMKNILLVEDYQSENSNSFTSNNNEYDEEDDLEENKNKNNLINNKKLKQGRNKEKRNSIFSNYIKKKIKTDLSDSYSSEENNFCQEAFYKIILNINISSTIIII